jgi:hypothetical protein
MPVYELTTDAIHPLEETSFISSGIRERSASSGSCAIPSASSTVT